MDIKTAILVDGSFFIRRLQSAIIQEVLGISPDKKPEWWKD